MSCESWQAGRDVWVFVLGSRGWHLEVLWFVWQSPRGASCSSEQHCWMPCKQARLRRHQSPPTDGEAEAILKMSLCRKVSRMRMQVDHLRRDVLVLRQSYVNIRAFMAIALNKALFESEPFNKIAHFDDIRFCCHVGICSFRLRTLRGARPAGNQQTCPAATCL